MLMLHVMIRHVRPTDGTAYVILHARYHMMHGMIAVLLTRQRAMSISWNFFVQHGPRLIPPLMLMDGIMGGDVEMRRDDFARLIRFGPHGARGELERDVPHLDIHLASDIPHLVDVLEVHLNPLRIGGYKFGLERDSLSDPNWYIRRTVSSTRVGKVWIRSNVLELGVDNHVPCLRDRLESPSLGTSVRDRTRNAVLATIWYARASGSFGSPLSDAPFPFPVVGGWTEEERARTQDPGLVLVVVVSGIDYPLAKLILGVLAMAHRFEIGRDR